MTITFIKINVQRLITKVDLINPLTIKIITCILKIRYYIHDMNELDPRTLSFLHIKVGEVLSSTMLKIFGRNNESNWQWKKRQKFLSTWTFKGWKETRSISICSSSCWKETWLENQNLIMTILRWLTWQTLMQSNLHDLPVLEETLHLTEIFCCSQCQKQKTKNHKIYNILDQWN